MFLFLRKFIPVVFLVQSKVWYTTVYLLHKTAGFLCECEDQLVLYRHM